MKRTLPILMLALLCGCGHNPAPQLTLPSAPYSYGIIDLDPRMPVVTIDEAGGLWFQDRQVSDEELRTRMRSRLTELHNPSVTIRADADLSMRTVREAINIIDSLGVGRQTFIVLREAPDRESVIDFVTTGPESPDFLVIEIGAEKVTLNGRAVDRDRLEQLISRLAAFSRSVSIVCIPSPELSFQRCIELLDTCRRVGLDKIHLLEKSPVTVLPDMEDAQHPSGPYFRKLNTTS